jgi:hypothetical protein
VVIADQRVLGNDSGAPATATPITIHQELDWIGESSWLFDGVDDYIAMGDYLPFERTSPFSLSCWIKTTALNGNLVTKYKNDANPRGWGLQFIAGKFRFWLQNSVGNRLFVDTNTLFNTGAWVHVVAAYTGSGLASGVTIYVNGVLQSTTTLGDTLSATILNVASLQIGGADSIGSAPAGLLKEVSAWNIALSLAQAGQVYASGTPPDLLATTMAASLLGWWKVDGVDTAAAGGVHDYSTGGHHGTAVGGLGGVPVGILPVRGAGLWEPVVPSSAALPLTSNGVGVKPTYRQIPLNAVTLASSTSITVNTLDIQRAALTGVVTAPLNGNATAYPAAPAKTVLSNPTNASAAPAFSGPTAALQYQRSNAANTAIEWGALPATGYSQTFTAAATWTVNHNLGRHPYSWAVETLGGVEIEVAVQHVSINQSVVMFDSQTAGTARFT